MTGSTAGVTSCTGRLALWPPIPNRSATTSPARLLAELDAAIRANDQSRACAITHRLGTLDHDPRRSSTGY